MKKIIYLLLILWSLPGYSNDAHHKQHKKMVGVEALSPELRKSLSLEMQALQKGMMSIIPAYISGNWSEIKDTANKMKNSYILKQSLTESQLKELHTLLPHDFIKKDKNFHYLAGMLEHAAENKKPELINFYFSEMNRSCVDCHSNYATHKFPALLPKKKKDEHHH